MKQTIKLIAITLALLTASTSVKVGHAKRYQDYYPVEGKLSYTLNCDVKTCKMLLTLKLPYETFAPAKVTWRYKINDGNYSKQVTAGTEYGIQIENKTQTVTVEAYTDGLYVKDSFRINKDLREINNKKDSEENAEIAKSVSYDIKLLNILTTQDTVISAPESGEERYSVFAKYLKK